jgi:hypothetical protein
MPLKHILKNKLLLQKHFHLQEIAMDEWPFWMLEENVKLVNEIMEEEESQRKKQEDDQSKGMGNFNANSMMSSASDMQRNLSSNSPKF